MGWVPWITAVLMVHAALWPARSMTSNHSEGPGRGEPLDFFQCEILWCEDFVIRGWYWDQTSLDLWTNESPGLRITEQHMRGLNLSPGWSSQFPPVSLKGGTGKKL